MKKDDFLSHLGLAQTAHSIYLAALQLGEANMQQLAKKANIKRTTMYGFIQDLKERGFIAETTKRKRKVYSAVHPAQLLEMQRSRLREMETGLPELLAMYNRSDAKPRVSFFEGVEGIKEVYVDTLSTKQPIVGWSDFEHMKEVLGNFYDEYPRERSRRSITFKTIVRDSATAREGAKKDFGLLRETKFISSGDLKTEINVYGNKVSLMSFRSTPPFAVLIEDADVAETLRTAWKNSWERM